VAGSAAGRAAVQSALGLLQGAVQRGGGGIGGLGSDALSLTPLPRAAESLVNLLRLALTPTRASPLDANATSSSYSEHDDSSSSSSSSRSRRYSHSSSSSDSSNSANATSDSQHGRNHHSNDSSSSSNATSSREGWDGLGMDSALATAGCRAAADFGRCVQSRLDPHVLAAYGRGSQLPATDAPESTTASSSSFSSGGGLLLGGGQQQELNRAAGSALHFASDVPLRAAESWAPSPPPPVGFTDLRTTASGVGGNDGFGGRSDNAEGTRTASTHHAPSSSLDLPPGLLHVPGSPWAAEETSEVVISAVAASQAAMEHVAELLLFGVIDPTADGPTGVLPTGGVPTSTGTGIDRAAGATRETGASLSSSSSSSTAPWPRWGPLLIAQTPWPLQLRCLEALVWLAHDASPCPAWWRHKASSAAADAADAATSPPGRRSNGNSRLSTSTGRSRSSSGSSGLGRNGLMGARAQHSFPPPPRLWLWRALRTVLLQSGPQLPIEARVELIDVLAARVATDGRAIGLALPEHDTAGAPVDGAAAAAAAAEGSHEGAGLSVRVALQVGVAWLKHEPSEALAEALRRLWATAANATATTNTASSSSSNAYTTEQMPPKATSSHEDGPDGYDSSAKLRWQLAGRRALIESLYDLLDWRVVSSRPDSATTDSLWLHDLSSAESEKRGTLSVSCADTLKGSSRAAAAANVNANAQAQAAEVSWAGAGGEPSFTAAWAVSSRMKRVALSVLVALAVHEASLASAATADVDAVAKSPESESLSPSMACDASFVNFDDGNEFDSNSNVNNSNTANTNSSGCDDHDNNSSICKNEPNDSATVAWVYGSLGSSLVTRLQAGVLTGELSHRRACIRGLARLALAWPDPARFSLYAFLHQVQIDTAHEHAAASNAANTGQDNSDERSNAQSFEQASSIGGAAEGMGVEDLLAPALLLMDCEYAAEDFNRFGEY